MFSIKSSAPIRKPVFNTKQFKNSAKMHDWIKRDLFAVFTRNVDIFYLFIFEILCKYDITCDIVESELSSILLEKTRFFLDELVTFWQSGLNMKTFDLINHAMKGYRASIIHSTSLGKIQVIEDAVIVVDKDGIITEVSHADCFSNHQNIEIIHFKGFIIPGFIDCHFHAPQYSFVGTGMEKPLLEWLNHHTFPAESKFSDVIYARKVYGKVVSRLLRNGTTTCSYFATLHLDATIELAKICHDKGQRAFIGKVNMDAHHPLLSENSSDSYAGTVSFIEKTKEFELVTPVITPRFVPSCTPELLKKLGELSRSHDPWILVQSHMNENIDEIGLVKSMYPEDTYAQVYNNFNLLHSRTYLAHCIYCSSSELALLKNSKCGVVHCPNSNISLQSGVLNVRKLLDLGIKVGLGTDVSGGFSTSMLDAIRNAIASSKLVALGLGSEHPDEKHIPNQTQYAALTFEEAFHLATLGGAECLDIAEKVGNFVVGKEFDALFIDPMADSGFDVFETDTLVQVFQKFLFLGDDRNIARVYVKGVLIA